MTFQLFLRSSSSLGSFKRGLLNNSGGGNGSGHDLDSSSGLLMHPPPPHISKLMRNSTKLKLGDVTDDIHMCIMCLRAVMNNKFDFNMVIQHKTAINCIALSLVRFL